MGITKETALVSIAINLKRIADVLERQYEPSPITAEMIALDPMERIARAIEGTPEQLGLVSGIMSAIEQAILNVSQR